MPPVYCFYSYLHTLLSSFLPLFSSPSPSVLYFLILRIFIFFISFRASRLLFLLISTHIAFFSSSFFFSFFYSFFTYLKRCYLFSYFVSFTPDVIFLFRFVYPVYCFFLLISTHIAFFFSSSFFFSFSFRSFFPYLKRCYFFISFRLPLVYCFFTHIYTLLSSFLPLFSSPSPSVLSFLILRDVIFLFRFVYSVYCFFLLISTHIAFFFSSSSFSSSPPPSVLSFLILIAFIFLISFLPSSCLHTFSSSSLLSFQSVLPSFFLYSTPSFQHSSAFSLFCLMIFSLLYHSSHYHISNPLNTLT
ncbi:unnamed protein product [Acanthosepion pharaonis]|uniref:Uncharacterized protein n=1 Tax=Acanthosepion pharaonis TaxID=158019 RepID=A0A812D5P7_ACAPH|nr:unnamed protein product [Sepia pharaonis]